jgi:hypothetical protein
MRGADAGFWEGQRSECVREERERHRRLQKRAGQSEEADEHGSAESVGDSEPLKGVVQKVHATEDV